MGFVKATAAQQPQFLKCLIYGNAGTGKTTFALSAPGPVALIDFDNGLHRVNYQHKFNVDVLQPTNWLEMIGAVQDTETMRNYQTIVVDTIDKMMDYIIEYKCGNRQPSIRDWGGINAEFTNFIRVIDMLQKNVIFISHESKSKEKDARGQDVTKYSASLREKNFTYIQNQLDLLGFVQLSERNGKCERTLTLHSDICDCKQPSGLAPQIVIPEVLDVNGNKTMENDLFSRLILTPYYSMKKRESEELGQFTSLVNQMRNDIDTIEDVETANAFLEVAKTYKHIGNSKAQMTHWYKGRLEEVGLKYDKASNSHVSVVPAPPTA